MHLLQTTSFDTASRGVQTCFSTLPRWSLVQTYFGDIGSTTARPTSTWTDTINRDVNLDIIQILKLLVGNTVAIATATHRRFHHEPDYDAVVLAYNPISDYITNGRP